MTGKERIVLVKTPEGLRQPVELMRFAGVQMPRYLIVASNYQGKMEKVRRMRDQINDELAQGTPGEDAGDTHGQYHNELAWYREQEIDTRTGLVKELGQGLGEAVIVTDYDIVRQALLAVGVDSGKTVAIGSKVTVEFNNDSEDTEVIMLVAPLDENFRPGWTSILTPLAQAIEGKLTRETTEFRVGDHVNRVKIISLA